MADLDDFFAKKDKKKGKSKKYVSTEELVKQLDTAAKEKEQSKTKPAKIDEESSEQIANQEVIIGFRRRLGLFLTRATSFRRMMSGKTLKKRNVPICLTLNWANSQSMEKTKTTRTPAETNTTTRTLSMMVTARKTHGRRRIVQQALQSPSPSQHKLQQLQQENMFHHRSAMR